MYEHKHLMQIVGAIAVLTLSVGHSFAENIDPYNDGSQYAYGENVGWINFDPNYGGVTIDADGDFDGWAWGENIGWIHFQSTSPVAYKVRVCVVCVDDFANLAKDWLKSGSGLPGDLDGDGDVDWSDLRLLVDKWLDYCPDGWPLKP